jgi:phosphatidylglycerol:prolipoprotein diacylglycerol transferase
MAHIETSQTTGVYFFLYSIIFIAVYFWLIGIGNKKSIPMLPWMVAIAMCFVGFSIGCKVIMMTTTEWLGLLHGSLPEIQGRSVIGGLLGALTGIILGNYLCKIPNKVIDQYALLLPLGIAVIRIGCLFAGCCYGTTTTVPWAITYDTKSAAYTSHAVHELIPYSNAISLPVHPVQLYEIA